MADIQKGIISTNEGAADANGNRTRARVIPEQADGVITKPLVIPKPLRGNAGALAKGTEVIFAVFPDQSGIILGRADGEWNGILYGDISVSGNITANGTVTASDVKTNSLTSVNSHRHGGVETGSGDSGIAKN